MLGLTLTGAVGGGVSGSIPVEKRPVVGALFSSGVGLATLTTRPSVS
jgi:hypothetical protein